VLKIDPSKVKGGLKALQLADSSEVVPGEPAIAIGSPFGLQGTVTSGIISALGREIQAPNGFTISGVIQTDAAINPGNSGGPLLDAHGRVIGINAQIKSQSGGGEGVGFAIPVDAVRRSLSELRRDGRVEYGYLGVQTVILWPQLAERLGIDAEAGALVQRVEPDSPAEDEGLDPGDDTIDFQGQPDIPSDGDVIVAVDGRPLTRTQDLSDVIGRHAEGEKVVLTVVRDGERRRVSITLGKRPVGSGP
jgi:S1-C subfamily serine protease